MTFQPYSHSQLLEIINSRLEGTVAFAPEACILAARKVCRDILKCDVWKFPRKCSALSVQENLFCNVSKCDSILLYNVNRFNRMPIQMSIKMFPRWLQRQETQDVRLTFADTR